MGVIVGPALGPVIGGWITDNWNWHWIFFINIPVGIIAATLIWNFLRNPSKPQYRKLDWVGLILMCIGLGSMQFVLENGQQYDWFDDTRIRLFTFLFGGRHCVVRMVDAAIEDTSCGSARLAVAPSRVGQRPRRGTRRQSLRFGDYLATVPHQLAGLYGHAFRRDRHGARGCGDAFHADYGDSDAAWPDRSRACRRRLASSCCRSRTGCWQTSPRRSPTSTPWFCRC